MLLSPEIVQCRTTVAGGRGLATLLCARVAGPGVRARMACHLDQKHLMLFLQRQRKAVDYAAQNFEQFRNTVKLARRLIHEPARLVYLRVNDDGATMMKSDDRQKIPRSYLWKILLMARRM